MVTKNELQIWVLNNGYKKQLNTERYVKLCKHDIQDEFEFFADEFQLSDTSYNHIVWGIPNYIKIESNLYIHSCIDIHGYLIDLMPPFKKEINLGNF